MKYWNVLCIFVLVVSLLGCRRSPRSATSRRRTQPPAPQVTRVAPRPEPGRITTSTNWEADADVGRLPEIIQGVFEELGITVENKDQGFGHYTYLGKSPAGVDVTVAAIAVVKGTSLVQVGVHGQENVAKVLLKKVSEALKKAVENKNR